MDQINGIRKTEGGGWLSYNLNHPEVLAQMNSMASASWHRTYCPDSLDMRHQTLDPIPCHGATLIGTHGTSVMMPLKDVLHDPCSLSASLQILNLGMGYDHA